MKGKLHLWLAALRPWSFSIGAISITIGTVWALDNSVSWGLYSLTLLAMVILHAASNLLNDYCDVKNKVDVPDSPAVKYRPHPLLHQEIAFKPFLHLIIILYTTGIILGIMLAIMRGWPVLIIGIIGALIGLTYTVRPIALKYHALGEPAVFLAWGPLAVSVAYYVQTQSFSLPLLLVSIPFGMLVALILLANNLRDLKYDQARHIHTLAGLLGEQGGYQLFFVLTVIIFLLTAVMSLAGPLSLWSLLVFLALPAALPLLKMIPETIPPDADVRTAKLVNAFGVLLILSIILAAG